MKLLAEMNFLEEVGGIVVICVVLGGFLWFWATVVAKGDEDGFAGNTKSPKG